MAPSPATAQRDLSPGRAANQKPNYIYKACCVYERVNGGSNYGVTAVLAQLRLNPLLFMGDNKVLVHGSNSLDPQPGRNVQSCMFEYTPGSDRYDFWVDYGKPGGNDSATIQVDSVT